MQELIDKVAQWAADKNLIPGNPERQILKLVSEVGELADEILRGELTTQTDELGDVFVVAIVLAGALGIKPEDALQAAYNKISKRKGETVNGIFVKEAT